MSCVVGGRPCDHHGSRSVTFKYTAAITKHREVWISKRFAQKHADITRVIRQCLHAGPQAYDDMDSSLVSAWTILPTCAAFLARKVGSFDKSATMLGLVTTKCKSDARLAGKKRLLDGPDLFKLITALDHSKSYYGREGV